MRERWIWFDWIMQIRCFFTWILLILHSMRNVHSHSHSEVNRIWMKHFFLRQMHTIESKLLLCTESVWTAMCCTAHCCQLIPLYIFFAFNCMYVAEKQFFILLILAQILSFFRFIVLHLANDCGISNYTNKKRREKRNIFVFLRLTDKIHLIQRHEQSIWNWQRKRKQHTFHRRICKTFLRLIYIHESRHVLYIIKLKLLKCNLEKCTKLKWNF